MSFKGKALNLLDMLAEPEDDWFGQPLLDSEELQIYIDAFKEGGFTAPMHWYRNMNANWKGMKRFLVKKKLPFIDLPALVVTSEYDFASPPQFANGMHKRIGPLKRVDLKECSHWVHIEKAEEVSSAIHEWLEETDWDTWISKKSSYSA